MSEKVDQVELTLQDLKKLIDALREELNELRARVTFLEPSDHDD